MFFIDFESLTVLKTIKLTYIRTLFLNIFRIPKIMLDLSKINIGPQKKIIKKKSTRRKKKQKHQLKKNINVCCFRELLKIPEAL